VGRSRAPGGWRRLWLSALVLALSLPAISAAQPAATTADGILHIVWGDPHPASGVGGATRFTLGMPNGSRLPLRLTGQWFLNGTNVIGTGSPGAAGTDWQIQ